MTQPLLGALVVGEPISALKVLNNVLGALVEALGALGVLGVLGVRVPCTTAARGVLLVCSSE